MIYAYERLIVQQRQSTRNEGHGLQRGTHPGTFCEADAIKLAKGYTSFAHRIADNL